MKKIILFLIMLLPLKVFSISASSAIAMDLDNSRILYGYNIDDQRLIASITKIMTAIVAIENSDLDKVVTVSDVIHEAFGSAIYIEVGEKLTLKDLLYGLMLRSGNDAALVIAQAVSGSEEEFVYLMNEYVTNLKMTNTIFYNPHGLEESSGLANKSSAYDMAKLTKYAMQNATFREIFKSKNYVAKSDIKTYSWHNKNKLLNLDYITGGKTGYTELARRTLVTTGTKNNMNVVVVTLNDPNDWKDHQDIYSRIFKDYESYLLVNKNDFSIKDNYYKENKLYIINDIRMTLKKEELDRVKINYKLMKLKEYYNNQVIGYAQIILDDTVYHEEPVYVEKIKKEEKKNFWDKFKGWLF